MALFHPSHGIYLAIIGLYIMSWLILLAGLSAVQHTCRDNPAQFTRFIANDFLANTLGGHCHKLLRFPWFLVALGILPLLVEAGALVGMFMHKAGRTNNRSTVGKGAALFAVIATLYILMTNTFYNMIDDGGIAGFIGNSDATDVSSRTGKLSSRIRCTLAGFALTAAFALLLMLLAPMCDTTGHNDHDDGRSVTTTQSEKRTGMVTTGGPTTTAAVPAHVVV